MPHGRFCWYELMTTDVAAAERFYAQVVGWQIRDAGMPDMRYLIASTADGQVGGIMALPEQAGQGGATPGWTGYVAVDDVDATAAKATAAGGVVHRPPTDIPGIGRFCVVADPQHVMFVLFKAVPASAPPAPLTHRPGHCGWHELATSDHEAALRFYAGLFGWRKDAHVDMGPMGGYQLFAEADGTQAIGGMMNRPAGMGPPSWLYYFIVDDIDAAVARVKKAAGDVLNGPMEVPGGTWVAQCRDPQGAAFALVGSRAGAG